MSSYCVCVVCIIAILLCFSLSISPSLCMVMTALVSLGNMVYAIGGSDGQQYVESVEYYDPSKLQWVSSINLPTPRFTPAAVTLSKRNLNN